IVLDTAVTLAGALVAVLAGVRFAVEGRRLDLLLCGGFSAAAAATLAFSIAPILGGHPLERTEAWAGVGGKLLAAALIAAAPFSYGRVSARGRALVNSLVAVTLGLAAIWGLSSTAGSALPALAGAAGSQQPFMLTGALAVQALL